MQFEQLYTVPNTYEAASDGMPAANFLVPIHQRNEMVLGNSVFVEDSCLKDVEMHIFRKAIMIKF